MFLRILKKDLREKIGFNIILFFFMVVASALVVASTLQLYANVAGYDRTCKMCNSSDLFLINIPCLSERTEQLEEIGNWFDAREDVANVEYHETIRFNSLTLDFDDYDERNSEQFRGIIYYLFKLPTGQDVVLDMEDKPFYVENGCVAIPRSMQLFTGADVGDKLRITTQMGYVYEFTISHIFKDPAAVYFYRIIVSDSDYEVIYNESPVKYDFYAVKQNEGSDKETQYKLMRDFMQNEELPVNISYAISKGELSNDVIEAKVVAMFLSIIGVFMILLILMTIRFTMISAIKREEREIGMMKALGVDSVYFKWLFAAKYIAFSVIGGAFGVVIGILLSNILLKQFSYNIVSVGMGMTIGIAVVAALSLTVLIILFTFFAMRRMDKVSVMDALHGENRGERFVRLPGVFIHKFRFLSVPMFLAITDIMGRIKRYVFLLVAYMFGVAIILMTVQLKDSVVCEDYIIKYNAMAKLDFEISLNAQMRKEYKAIAGSQQGVINLVNEDFAENNIPAKIEIFNIHRAALLFEDNEYQLRMLWGIEDTADVTYRKGSIHPRLYNEVALDYYTASKIGIEIGDTIGIKYEKRTDDRLSSEIVTEEFIVTGFFNYAGSGIGIAIMNNEFDDAVVNHTIRFRAEIYAPESEKPYYIEQMKKLYGAEQVQNQDEIVESISGNWNIILTLIRDIMFVVVVLVLALITVLYQNIFLEEEEADIALQKSMGFHNGSIWKWQYYRMILLVVSAIVLGILFTATFGNWFIGMAFEILVQLSGFRLLANPVMNYVLLPAILVCIVTIILVIVLRPMKKIQVWRVRNE